jgi:ketosteroid isomerase-like protein
VSFVVRQCGVIQISESNSIDENLARGGRMKRKYRLPNWILAGGMLLLATTLAAQSRAEVAAFRAAVEDILEKKKATCLKSNLAGYVSIWDENATKIPSVNPTVLGISAIRDNQRRVFQNWLFQEIDTNIEEFHLAGDFGWAHGTYWVQIKSKVGRNWIITKGTILTIFKKQNDGSWKIYCDVAMPASQVTGKR